jgi:hypothetical protein
MHGTKEQGVKEEDDRIDVAPGWRRKPEKKSWVEGQQACK